MAQGSSERRICARHTCRSSELGLISLRACSGVLVSWILLCARWSSCTVTMHMVGEKIAQLDVRDKSLRPVCNKQQTSFPPLGGLHCTSTNPTALPTRSTSPGVELHYQTRLELPRQLFLMPMSPIAGSPPLCRQASPLVGLHLHLLRRRPGYHRRVLFRQPCLLQRICDAVSSLLRKRTRCVALT